MAGKRNDKVCKCIFMWIGSLLPIGYFTPLLLKKFSNFYFNKFNTRNDVFVF